MTPPPTTSHPDTLHRRALALLWRRVSFNPARCGFTISREQVERLVDRRRAFGDGFEASDILEEVTRLYRGSWVEPVLKALIVDDRAYLERWCYEGFRSPAEEDLSPAALVDLLRAEARQPAPVRMPNSGAEPGPAMLVNERPSRLHDATRRLLDEIDRTQRSGRTLVGFPTELLAAVEDVREALGLPDGHNLPSATDRAGRSLPAASIPPSHPTQAPDPAGAPPLGGR